MSNLLVIVSHLFLAINDELKKYLHLILRHVNQNRVLE